MEIVGGEWAVMSWNIQGTKGTDLDRVAQVIAAQTPDVVVLQEARRPQAGLLATRLSMSHSWIEKHHPWRPFFPGRAEGAAILTPHRLLSPGHAQISDESSKRSYRRRIVQWATIERDDASRSRVYNAHLSPHDLVAERLAEAGRIAAIVVAHGDAAPVVVAGDFNDAGEPEIIATLPGIEMFPAPATNPAGAPSKALDHVLVPASATHGSISTSSGGPQWAELSDHLPVTVRFRLDGVADGKAC